MNFLPIQEIFEIEIKCVKKGKSADLLKIWQPYFDNYLDSTADINYQKELAEYMYLSNYLDNIYYPNTNSSIIPEIENCKPTYELLSFSLLRKTCLHILSKLKFLNFIGFQTIGCDSFNMLIINTNNSEIVLSNHVIEVKKTTFRDSMNIISLEKKEKENDILEYLNIYLTNKFYDHFYKKVIQLSKKNTNFKINFNDDYDEKFSKILNCLKDFSNLESNEEILLETVKSMAKIIYIKSDKLESFNRLINKINEEKNKKISYVLMNYFEFKEFFPNILTYENNNHYYVVINEIFFFLHDSIPKKKMYLGCKNSTDEAGISFITKRLIENVKIIEELGNNISFQYQISECLTELGEAYKNYFEVDII